MLLSKHEQKSKIKKQQAISIALILLIVIAALQISNMLFVPKFKQYIANRFIQAEVHKVKPLPFGYYVQGEYADNGNCENCLGYTSIDFEGYYFGIGGLNLYKEQNVTYSTPTTHGKQTVTPKYRTKQ